MAAKSKNRAKPGVDRTKYRATASRSGGQGKPEDSWWQVGCGFLIGGFLWLLATFGGVSLVVHGAIVDLPLQFGHGTSPVLHMRIESCEKLVHGKNSTIKCYGYGDPGNSGVVDEQWMIASAVSVYAPGEVVDVRCSRTGGCEEAGPSAMARDVAETAFGLLLASGGVTLLVLGIRSRTGRGAPSRRTVRAGIVAAGILGLVGLTSAIVASAT